MTSVPLELFAEAEVPVGVPLSGGLLGLGGDTWLVVDPRTVGVAARVHPDQDFVRFQEGTRARGDGERWELWFVEGEATALALAARLTNTPDVHVPPIDGPPDEPDGCQCTTAAPDRPTAGLAAIWALAGLGATGRRRRRP